MPELPDIETYLRCLRPRILGQTLRGVRIRSPFVLRSVEPPMDAAVGREVVGLRRLGKRVVVELAGGLHLVLHLMVAGRLRWRAPGVKLGARLDLAAFDFDAGALVLTEAGTRKRASLHLVEGEGLAALDPGGLEVLQATQAQFRAALTRENHTLKRALTDPHILGGIGNATSDEILHAARMSPFRQTSQLTDEELALLYETTRRLLEQWTERLAREVGDGFPERVTAFRADFAVHGRHREPCPVCGDPVQRIVYAANEANYCATCQTGGKLLADRARSRLLGRDWPRTLEQFEQRRAGARGRRR